MTDLNSLVVLLEEITSELTDNHRELGSVLAAEHEGRIRSWWDQEVGTPGNVRDKAGQMNTLDLTSDIFKLKADIAALEAQRLLVLTRIDVLKVTSHGTA